MPDFVIEHRQQIVFAISITATGGRQRRARAIDRKFTVDIGRFIDKPTIANGIKINFNFVRINAGETETIEVGY